DYTLASPGQAGLATFLGGPLAGVLLIARNYFKLHRRVAGVSTLAVGLAVTSVALIFASVLPDTPRPSHFLLPVLLWIITYGAARAPGGSVLRERWARGGAQVSGWVVLGYPVVGIALLFGLLIGGFAGYEAVLGAREYKVTANEEILYGREITAD